MSSIGQNGRSHQNEAVLDTNIIIHSLLQVCYLNCLKETKNFLMIPMLFYDLSWYMWMFYSVESDNLTLKE